MKIITRAGCKRLAIVAVVLTALLAWAYYTMIGMPGKSHAGPLPPLTAEQKKLSERMRRDLLELGGNIGERNIFVQKKLHAAADFVERSFAAQAYQVRRQTFTVMGETCANLEVIVPGRSRRDEIVVVGAHYDSVQSCPGANDNGSGVVALLALSEKFAKHEPARTLRLVAFVNEEPPFFQTNAMGSAVYAREVRAKGEKVIAMLSLETMGYYSDEPGSQKYPFPLGLLYPSRGNFIGFVGNTSSRALVRDCIAVFRKHASFPSEGAALPADLPGIGWSDHWSFWQEGYSAIMITDTAPFRYPHYHTMEDTPEKVDYDRLARVTEGAEKVIWTLLNPDAQK